MASEARFRISLTATNMGEAHLEVTTVPNKDENDRHMLAAVTCATRATATTMLHVGGGLTGKRND
eukprot:8629331-Alexandrium_andersonii.AAC.1